MIRVARPPRSPGASMPAVLPAPPHTSVAPPRSQWWGRRRPPARDLRGRPPLARGWLLAGAALVVALHVVANAVSPYGVHRDELLYLAMGHHLRLWAMDFPPAIALLAETTRSFASDLTLTTSTVALRLTPALAAAALVFTAGLLARTLGGGRGAQLLAAGTVAASPLFLRTGTLFQPVVFDQLWWTLGLLALVRLGGRPHPGGRRALGDWLLLGAATGLGLLTKFSIAVFALGALVGILAIPSLRAALRTRGPWLAAGLALVIGSPSLVGQVALGWPVVGQMRDLNGTQLTHVGWLDFVAGQLLLGPAVVLAGLGVWALFRSQTSSALRAGRAAGWACVVAFVVLLVLRGKPYYVAPVYPFLWAAGATGLWRWARGRTARASADADISRLRAWGRRVVPDAWRAVLRTHAVGLAAVAIAAYGALTLPFGLPILPPPAMARYAATLGAGTATNTGGRLALPQDYADMLGWPELAGAVAAAWATLPPAVQADAALLAGNYGEAGALELYGPALGLPPVVSAAGSYWFFGPGERVGNPIVAVGVPERALAGRCARVQSLGVVRHAQARWLVPEEQQVPVTLCEGPRQTLRELWPSLAGRN